VEVETMMMMVMMKSRRRRLGVGVRWFVDKAEVEIVVGIVYQAGKGGGTGVYAIAWINPQICCYAMRYQCQYQYQHQKRC
jgi:hypothetical protein